MKKSNKILAAAIATFIFFNITAPAVCALGNSTNQDTDIPTTNIQPLKDNNIETPYVDNSENSTNQDLEVPATNVPPLEDVTLEDSSDFKIYFRELHGSEDKFVPFKKYDNVSSEVNGAKGIIRMNKLDNNGNIIDSYDINVFENTFENMKQNKLLRSSRSAKKREAIVLDKITTGSPIDKFSLAVYTKGNYSRTFRLSIGNNRGSTTSYYKDQAWKTGNTKNFYNSLTSAAGNVSDIKKSLKGAASFATVMFLYTKYVGAVPVIGEVVVLLETIGISSITSAAVGTHIIKYFINIRNCGSYYNAII